MTTYTANSFFSGIGGLDLAFAAAGFDILAQVENDEFCQQVLRKHSPRYWPSARIFGDIRLVDRRQLEAADCFFGGFPCQDISISGKRAGLTDDTRSGLWFEFARLIGDLRPRVVLLENVPNILHVGGSIVVGQLTEMGYDALWLSLQAAEFGAPHQRERWFAVAYDNRQRRQEPSAGQSSPNQKWDDTPHRRTWQSEFHAAFAGSEAVEYAALVDESRRSGQRGNRRWPASPGRQHLRAVTAYAGQTVGHSDSIRMEAVRALGRTGAYSRRGTRQSEGANNRDGQSFHLYQSRLGIDVDGISYGLAAHRWPAGQGTEQYPYEPPRVLAQTTPHWQDKVRAVGNAVVPQQVYPLAVALREFLSRQA